MINLYQIKAKLLQMLQNEKSTRTGWIDFVRGFAILAVVLNHSNAFSTIFSNARFIILSFFSVTLLIFISGYNFYNTYFKRKILTYPYKLVVKKAAKLFVPYVLAITLTSWIITETYDLMYIIKQIPTFSTWGPYYYVFLYLQLLLISPVMYFAVMLCCKKSQSILHKTINTSVLIVCVYIVSYFSFASTKTFEIWGGAKYIGGGSYLLVMATGMLMANFTKSNISVETKEADVRKRRVFLWIAAAISWISLFVFAFFWERNNYEIFSFETKIWFIGATDKAQSATVLFYSVLVFISLYFLYNAIETLPPTCMKLCKLICLPIETCGKYSMDIFLYHMPVQYFILLKANKLWATDISRTYKILILFSMVFVPILVRLCYNKVAAILKQKVSSISYD
ncbi:MAG: acyltransferase [Christensenella sp.]